VDIVEARVEQVDGSAKLWVAFTDGRAMHIPLSEQVALVLNAGGWMMREYVARVFEADLKSTNLVSRRIRMIDIGPPAPRQ
jgi:hypothetical protein